MQDISSEFMIAEKFLEEFAHKHPKFIQRYSSLRKCLDIFIEEAKLSAYVRVDPATLGFALFNYFEDIIRLKEFHHVGHVNNIKIVAYTSYWLARMKPLQVVEPSDNTVYINERFVLSYILSFLEKRELGCLLDRNNKGLHAFIESLFYYLKYRTVSAQVIEMMIISFFAGQIYQETDEDISESIGKFPKDFSDEAVNSFDVCE